MLEKIGSQRRKLIEREGPGPQDLKQNFAE